MNIILLRQEEAWTSFVRLDDARARHLAGVLHVRPGSTVRVGIIDGPTGVATVLAQTGDAVALSCAWDAQAPEVPAIDLLLALPRPKVLRRLWAQLAALGVGRIALTNAARVERNYFDTHILEPAHFEPLLVEGLQQAGATRLPRVELHRRFRPMVEDVLPTWGAFGAKLLFEPGAEEPLLPSPLTAKRVLVAIGPEGGWVPFELDLFARAGFRRVGMGERTLRSDTACVAALALARHALALRAQTV